MSAGDADREGPDLSRYADDRSDPVVSSGLRALRDQTASQASRRAALRAVGVEEGAGAGRDGALQFALWAALALALTLVALVLAR